MDSKHMSQIVRLVIELHCRLSEAKLSSLFFNQKKKTYVDHLLKGTS